MPTNLPRISHNSAFLGSCMCMSVPDVSVFMQTAHDDGNGEWGGLSFPAEWLMARYVRELEHCQFELRPCTHLGWGLLSAESLHSMIFG